MNYNYNYEWTQKLVDKEFKKGVTLRNYFKLYGKSLMPFFLKMIHTNIFYTNSLFKDVYPISRVLEYYDEHGKLPENIKDRRNLYWAVQAYLNFRIKARDKKRLYSPLKKDIVILNSAGFDDNNNFWKNIADNLKDYHNITYDRFWQINDYKKLKEINDAEYIGNYYSNDTLKYIKYIHETIRTEWDKIRNDPDLEEIFNYKGVNIYSSVKTHLDFIFIVMSLYIAEVIAVTENIIDNKHKVILIDHEDNYYGLGCMWHKNRMKSKTKIIALSYELIYPGCMASHIKNKQILDKKSSIYRPLPDLKIVANKREKEILVKYCNYPKKIIKILGNHRYDHLKNMIREENFSYKNVFYAMSERTQYLENIINMFKDNPYYRLFIKPHPNTNKRLVEKAIKNHKNCVLYNGNTIEIIAKSDLVIIDTSSVGTEAILLNKALLIVNEEGCSPQEYEKENVANAIKINMLIKKDFRDIINCNTLERNRKLYIDNNFKNYGQASKKIVQEVEKYV